MKRILCAAFALLMLFGCSPAQESADPAALTKPNETASAVSSAVSAGEEVPFLLSEHCDTWWADAKSEYHSYTRYLDVDQSGNAVLSLCGSAYLVTPKDGNTYLLSAELSENLYSDQVCCIRLGEIRLWTDNAAVRVEMINDRFALFSHLSEADLRMFYQKTHHEWQFYDWPDISPSSMPGEQPHTDWVTMFWTGDTFNRLELHSDDNGLVQGTLERSEGSDVTSVIPCAMLMGSGYVCLVKYDENGYGDLLLLGSIIRPSNSGDRPNEYVALCIKSAYCSLGKPVPHSPYYTWNDSDKAGILRLIKETFDTGSDAGAFDVYEALKAGDYRLSMGVDRIVAEYYLCGSGWTRIRPQQDHEQWYRVYQKDGDTLVLFFDDELTDSGLIKYINGYACYDTKGTVKAWGGLKPLDHTFVDAYEFKKDESDFRLASGVTGYFITDHDELYVTDDMRFVLVTQFNGDYAFEVYPILPPKTEN